MQNEEIELFYSDEDKCWFAICSKYPLLSAYGDTKEEATAEFKIVLADVKEWIEESREITQKCWTELKNKEADKISLKKDKSPND